MTEITPDMSDEQVEIFLRLNEEEEQDRIDCEHEEGN